MHFIPSLTAVVKEVVGTEELVLVALPCGFAFTASDPFFCAHRTLLPRTTQAPPSLDCPNLLSMHCSTLLPLLSCSAGLQFEMPNMAASCVPYNDHKRHYHCQHAVGAMTLGRFPDGNECFSIPTPKSGLSGCSVKPCLKQH